METVGEMSKQTGISVRTLHYYDRIGLLKPSRIAESGYRLYGSEALRRLQRILFFRELGFPLKEIQRILDSPSYDPRRALKNQRRLLLMERDRLDGLIRLADRTLKGEENMSFEEFSREKIDSARRQYAEEAEKRWGNTSAYREYREKTASYGEEDQRRIHGEAEKLYRAFAADRKKSPGDPEVQKLVEKWQSFLTRNFYRCTPEILAGLGAMYTADERFRKNIDRYGEGLAEFMSKAIAVYCGRRS